MAEQQETRPVIEARTVTEKDAWGYIRVVGGFGFVGRDKDSDADTK